MGKCVHYITTAVSGKRAGNGLMQCRVPARLLDFNPAVTLHDRRLVVKRSFRSRNAPTPPTLYYLLTLTVNNPSLPPLYIYIYSL